MYLFLEKAPSDSFLAWGLETVDAGTRKEGVDGRAPVDILLLLPGAQPRARLLFGQRARVPTHRIKPSAQDSSGGGVWPVVGVVLQEAANVRPGNGIFLPSFPPGCQHVRQGNATVEEKGNILQDGVVRIRDLCDLVAVAIIPFRKLP